MQIRYDSLYVKEMTSVLQWLFLGFEIWGDFLFSALYLFPHKVSKINLPYFENGNHFKNK